MRIGKGELIKKVQEKLSKEYDLSPSAASIIVDAIFESVTGLLEERGRVNIPKFGTFVVIESKDRTARNPRTGEPIHVPAKKRIKFRPSGNLGKQFN